MRPGSERRTESGTGGGEAVERVWINEADEETRSGQRVRPKVHRSSFEGEAGRPSRWKSSDWLKYCRSGRILKEETSMGGPRHRGGAAMPAPAGAMCQPVLPTATLPRSYRHHNALISQVNQRLHRCDQPASHLPPAAPLDLDGSASVAWRHSYRRIRCATCWSDTNDYAFPYFLIIRQQQTNV